MVDNVHKFYNSCAAQFDEEQKDFGFVRVPEWEIAYTTIRRIAEKNHSVLEIGAGTGRFTLEVAPLVKQVTAVDISENMLNFLSQKAEELNIHNIKPVCGDFLKNSFNEKFDMIISFSSIEYILDVKTLFAKISNLLKPGGYLLLTTSHDTFFRWWGRMGNYIRQGIFMEAYSKNRMKKLLNENGLEVKEMADLCLKSFFVKGILLFVYAVK